jgi:hypothetical protein
MMIWNGEETMNMSDIELVFKKPEEEKLEFNDDKLFVCTPLPQYGEGVYKTKLVMTKEAFQECYKKWIEP